MTGEDLGCYVHFPWCVRKCPYCDFNSHPLRSGGLDEAAYLAAVLSDLQAQLDALPATGRIGTVFFGGGTPSLFSPDAFAALLALLAPRLAVDAEITLEANPGTTEHHDLAGYRSAGINRLSLGVQSFDDTALKALGRIHGTQDVFRSFAGARDAGFANINLDLMYGLPEQTRDQALRDLQAALDLEPEHVSWYQLTVEPKTEFARRPPRLPGDLLLEAIETAGYPLLAGSGFHRYEVSAFAQPGHQCRHNLNYWRFGDYLGAGAGAQGKLSRSLPDGVIRTSKASQPRLYQPRPTETSVTLLTPEELPGEFMMNALRFTDGVPLERFEEATGLALDVLEPVRRRQIEHGLLAEDRLAATDRGYALLDRLIQDYL